MASTHYFALGTTFNTLIHPANPVRKLDSFIVSLNVGRGPDDTVIVVEGLEGSVGNSVSYLLPSLITL